ncbi:Hypothetical protein NTJ_00686 [Nesidiocoris tenuis]|uniref:Uncharacterized protein n=1 Tax=Nesidiocoris tenuis TaxID=355587 RepID=A0ABN7A6L4_9HEMI|nr:Hypothetical protein NTJ_00686 [Nesidiocoris tenuis]
MRADKQLSWLYAASSTFGVLNLICMSVAWLYWTRTLNTCQTSDTDYNHSNCGCILYGVWGEFTFKGGSAGFCYFVTLVTIPVAIWSGLLALYHGYRGCCSVAPIKMTLITKDRVKAINTQLWPLGVIVFLTFMSGAIFLLMTVSLLVQVIGYNMTCQQYKKFIVAHLNANGMLAKAIYERLPCEVSYDLMDFLQPDPNFLDYRYRRGSSIIDTDLMLKISMWSNVMIILIYFVITVVNVKCSRMPKVSMVLNTEL